MPEAESFISIGSISETNPNAVLFTGFPFLLTKVDVSGYDHWTTLGGFNKDDTGSPTTQEVNDSLASAMKLFWNYNGHAVDLEFTTLTIDIEQDDFDNGSAPAPFEPKSRVCRSGWSFSQSDKTGGDEFMKVDYPPIRMYNGLTDSEDNFVGYGVLSSGSVLDGVFLATDQFDDFSFLSYANDGGTGVEFYEYSSAIDGIWFVAGARGGDVPPSINGLSAEFLFDGGGTLTFTYQDFDFWTYPA